MFHQLASLIVERGVFLQSDDLAPGRVLTARDRNISIEQLPEFGTERVGRVSRTRPRRFNRGSKRYGICRSDRLKTCDAFGQLDRPVQR
jgi:hypothetical protein